MDMKPRPSKALELRRSTSSVSVFPPAPCSLHKVPLVPACAACHLFVCHSSKNWIKDKKDPVKKSHNTPEFVKQLKQNYKQLTKGANYGKQNKR